MSVAGRSPGRRPAHVRRPAEAARRREDGNAPDRIPREDDVTDPGTANEADRAEQEALLDPPAVTVAGDAATPGDGVPEADALDQQLAARPGEAGGPRRSVGDREANEADLLEQDTDVPSDDDDIPG
jgi:hypothetical protein